MTTNASKRPVRMAFEASTARIAIADILPGTSNNSAFHRRSNQIGCADMGV